MTAMAQCEADCSAVCMQGVSFAYDRAPVLEGVDLSIARGELVCIVGPNGGGKTTLVRLILGLLRPQSGQIRVFGRSPQLSRLQIGYMPQQLRFDPQFPVSVLDVVRMGRLGLGGLRELIGLGGRDDRAAALRALDEVGLGEEAARPLADLSGGQRQRVLIARALAADPQMLVLDEPTANVDSAVGLRLLELLRELSRRMTILIVSHDLGFVSHLVRKVICVNRTVAVHPTSELAGDAIHALYGGPVRAVQHADVMSPGGHRHD